MEKNNISGKTENINGNSALINVSKKENDIIIINDFNRYNINTEKDVVTMRNSNNDDKSSIYKLWQLCFGDSNNFCDWFFEYRFKPEYSYVLLENNEIVSSFQSVPYKINVRGVEVSGAMLCGISTNPKARKKGYMTKLFNYSMEELLKCDFLLGVHTPSILNSYYNFGHFPVSKACYIEEYSQEIKKDDSNYKNFNFLELDFTRENSDILYEIYIREIANIYSGSIYRTKYEFYRKWADYNSDGGKCYCLYENNIITGYTFFYITESELTAVEVVTKEHLYNVLVDYILNSTKNVSCKIKLPPNVEGINKYNYSIVEKGVSGCINISKLLATVSSIINIDSNNISSIEVFDNVIVGNNGIFNLQGGISQYPPCIKINSGNLLQVLLGYKTFEDLKDKVVIYDENGYNIINSIFTICKCYIIDEY